MTQIIAAFGTHPHASAALRWAARLADRTGDDLVAVNVFDRTYAEMSPATRDQLIVDRRRLVRAALAEVTDREVTIEVPEGDPHPVLAARADRPDVEYVAVGQHGVSHVGPLSGGGTAHHLIHHTSCPVVVVGDDEGSTGGPVLVGIDGSPSNAKAIEVARRLAKDLGTEPLAVFCPDPAADSYPHAPGWTYRHEEEVRDEFRHLLDPECPLVIEPGHPTETLARLAKERGAAALVVGTRGRGGFHGLVAGRVATQLLRHAPVPLVVVSHTGH